jgi:hypothetical protein
VGGGVPPDVSVTAPAKDPLSFANKLHEHVARTSVFEVRGSSLVGYPALYSDGVSRLRRPFLSDGFFFVTVRLLNERSKLSDADFPCLALAFNRAGRTGTTLRSPD